MEAASVIEHRSKFIIGAQAAAVPRALTKARLETGVLYLFTSSSPVRSDSLSIK